MKGDSKYLNILTFTTLFPNSETPHHGVFVAERLHQLLSSGKVRADVIAPVPWFPFKARAFGNYARYARVPKQEYCRGLYVHHPRYLSLPKFGMSVAPFFLALAGYQAIRRQITDISEIDLIDAHYFYPDGVAAVLIGRLLNKPVLITGRGTDLNLIPDFRIPRSMIRWAAGKSSAIVTVSDALRKQLLDLGVDSSKVTTIRSGVDLELFRPIGRKASAKSKLGIVSKCILSVGHLIERKGHHHVIKALEFLPDDVHLIVIGEGPWKKRLEKLAQEIGVWQRVSFRGSVSHAELVNYYNAADALVLASSREGIANVLLESMACGTPVIATKVWGAPEVVDSSAAGKLVESPSGIAIAHAIDEILANPPSREEVRNHAERFNWEATSASLLTLFRDIKSREER